MGSLYKIFTRKIMSKESIIRNIIVLGVSKVARTNYLFRWFLVNSSDSTYNPIFNHEILEPHQFYYFRENCFSSSLKLILKIAALALFSSWEKSTESI